MCSSDLKSQISMAHASLVVAALSLATAVYQGYLNTRNVEVFQADARKRESMRACRDSAEFFFDARLRVECLREAAAAGEPGKSIDDYNFEARRAVARFAAVATYLANFSVEESRARYSRITRDLEALTAAARKPEGEDFARRIDAAQALFNALNDDCVPLMR